MINSTDFSRKKVTGIILTNVKNKLVEYGLYLEKRADEYLYTISIVDVPETIRPNSAGLERAFEMIESHFQKGQYQTLLPRMIYEEKIVLQENKDRPTISFAFKIQKSGEYQCLGIRPTVFKARKRYHFQRADHILKAPQKDPDGIFFTTLEELACILRNKRLEKSALASYEPLNQSNEIEMNRAGLFKVTSPEEQFNSYHYLNEILHFTNVAMGQYLLKEDIPVFYIKQNPPTQAYQLESDTISEEQIFQAQKKYYTECHCTLPKEELSSRPALHWASQTTTLTSLLRPASKLSTLVNFYNIKAYLEKENFPFPQEELESLKEEIEKGLKKCGIEESEHHSKKLKRYFGDENDCTNASQDQQDLETEIKASPENINQDQWEEMEFRKHERQEKNYYSQAIILDYLNKEEKSHEVLIKIQLSVEKYINERVISAALLFKMIMMGRTISEYTHLADLALSYLEVQGNDSLNVILEGKKNNLWFHWEFESMQNPNEKNAILSRLVILRGSKTSFEKWTTSQFTNAIGIKNAHVRSATQFIKDFYHKRLVLWQEAKAKQNDRPSNELF